MTEDKKRSRSEAKRARIRMAAYQSFRDQSYNEASVDTICRCAGISKGSFYWHYDSKHEVFVDILETWTREVMDELLQQFEESIEAEDRYGAISKALVREVHRGRAIVPLWLEFTTLARRDPEIRAAISRFFRRARAAVSETLRPHIVALNEVEIQGLAATIFAAYMGLVIQDLVDSKWANAELMLSRTMGVFERIMTVYSASSHEPADAAARPPAASAVGVEAGQRASRKELEALLQASPSASKRLAMALRQRVLEVAPGANERMIPGWRVLAYGAPSSKLFAFIKVRRGDVQLGFYQGVSLEDPGGVLEGKGKRRRHLIVSSLDQLGDDALRVLLLEAQQQATTGR